MLAIKSMQGLASGFLPVYFSLFFCSTAPSVSSLLGLSQHLAPKQGPEGASSFQGFLTVPKDTENSSREIGGQ